MTNVDPPRFDGKNFQLFAHLFRTWCTIQGLEKYLADSRSTPETAQARAKVKLTILSSLPPEVATPLLNKAEPWEIWDALDLRFNGDKNVRKQKVLHRLMNLKFSTMEELIIRFQTTVAELTALDVRMDPQALCLILFKQVPERFRSITDQITGEILINNSSYNVEIVCKELQALLDSRGAWTSRLHRDHQHDRSLNQTNNNKNKSSNKVTGSQGHSRSRKCFNCGEPGHISRDCAYSTPVCYVCKKPGHSAASCKSSSSGNQSKKKKTNSGSSSTRTNASLVYCQESDDSSSDEEAGVAADGKIMSLGSSAVRRSATDKKEKQHNKYLLDSGATDHAVNDETLLHNIRRGERMKSYDCANGGVLQTTIFGTMNSILPNGERIVLEDVSFIPELRQNVISISKLAEKYIVSFSGNTVTVSDSTAKLYSGDHKNGVYVLKLTPEGGVLHALPQVWHYRLGHPHAEAMTQTSKCVAGMVTEQKRWDKKFCDGCMVGKMKNDPIPKKTKTHRHEDVEVGEKLHVDLVGPIKPRSYDHKKYFVLVTDDKSSYRWVNTLKKKNESEDFILKTIARLDRQMKIKTKVIHTDNGGEFISTLLRRIADAAGIDFELITPEQSFQNGLAERSNGAILNKARSMRVSSNVRPSFWSYAVETAVYVANRTYTTKVNKTPFEAVYQRQPHVDHLRIFGSFGYALRREKSRDKVKPRSDPVVMLGYAKDSRSYIVFNLETKKTQLVRTVKFDELGLLKKQKNRVEELSKLVHNDSGEEFEDVSVQPATSREMINESAVNTKVSSATTMGVRRSPRNHTNSAFYLLRADLLSVPRSFNDIARRLDAAAWYAAYEKELSSIETIGRLKAILKPEGVRPVPLKELFSRKIGLDGMEVVKVRFVARGDLQQVEDIPQNVYSPVSTLENVRLIMIVSITNNWPLVQADINTAFLYSKSSSVQYLKLPKGHPAYSERHEMVWAGKCCIYGLKEAPKAWNATFDQFLTDLGFTNCEVDPCLYMRGQILLVLYVDDMLITGPSAAVIQQFMDEVGKSFKYKISENVTKFLGVEIERVSDCSLSVTQQQNINKLQTMFNLPDVRMRSPLQKNIETTWKSENTLTDRKLFQSVIGQLNYIALNSRMDIAYAVSQLAQFNQDPTKEALSSAKSVIRYLASTKDRALKFEVNERNKFTVNAYCDASLGRTEDCKPAIGFVIALNGCIYKYRAKKFENICDSIFEAEFMSIYCAGKEVAALVNVLSYIGVKVEQPIIWNDNLMAVEIANNNANITRVRHIQRKYFKVREQVKEGQFKVKYISTTSNVADMLTKTVGPNILDRLMKQFYH